MPKGVQKVFLTGGAGFIGSHIVDMLLERGYRVTVYDNLSTGKKDYVSQHFDNLCFNFIDGDILDFEHLKICMGNHDLVWHLAANTDILLGYKYPQTDLKNGIIGTHNVLDAMRYNNIQTILFASSGAIYGNLCKKNNVNESAGPILPLSLYGASKMSCEGLISAYCNLFDLRALIFRFGNVIGKRMLRGAIYDFIEKLRHDNTKLEILGDGNQEKNYFLVEECIEGMIYALRNAKITNENPCDIFNLGTNSVTKVTTIAQLVIEAMKLENVKIGFTGGETGWPGDQPQVHMLFDKINNLGWHTKYTSNEAIRIAIKRLL